MDTFEILVAGQVTGVGFRNYVAQVAKKLGVFGNVRNLSDGRVKIIIQAKENTLQSFKKEIAIPQHLLMRVTHITVNQIQYPQNFTDFRIIY